MRTPFILGIIFCFISFLSPAQQRSSQPRITPAGKGKVVPYADNIGYWIDMVKRGYVEASLPTPWVPAKPLGSAIRAVNVPPRILLIFR